MNVLVVAATEFEIKNFLREKNDIDILITGVGIPATIYNLTNKLFQKKYDFVVQAGIGGTFNDAYKLGDVVMIETDTFGDIGIDEKQSFKTLFDLGFANENDFPFANGWLFNQHEYLNRSPLIKAKAVTVNKIIDDEILIERMRTKFMADVESMEGAAFHYVCLQQKINFLQLRSISNTVGERNKEKWKIKEAITNLNVELKKLVENLS